ncbi:TonB-dependent receptor [Phocaeicola sartorii]|uniref:TonB-dependent receptor n=1 Tax=Phocaeicola sartorii TaxID=671267 RepID=UPI00351368F1
MNKFKAKGDTSLLLTERNIHWTRLLLAAFLLSIFQVVNAQQTRITLNVQQVTLKQVLKDIEQKTEYTFLYNDAEINVNRKVTVQVENEPLNVVLPKILPDNPWVVKGKRIVLMPKQENKKENGKKVTVSGTVTDEKGEALIGVNVTVPGTSTGMITDIDGKYAIIAAPGQSIQFSYIGYHTETAKIGYRPVINMVLQEDTEVLEEVVVVGYGTQKKVNLTGAVGMANAKDLQNKAITNALEGLQGLIPNFNITYSDGNPGSTPDLNIRGYESINGGSPLIIIDGTQSNEYLLSRLNPEDIENISILKDASSAAIYGARAAFGVVLVTTKSGNREMEKTEVTVTSNLLVSSPYYLPEMVNTYIHAKSINEALRKAGDPIRFKEEDVEKMRLYHMDPSKYPIDEIKENGDYHFWGTINYMDESLKKTALRSRNNINISGGSKLVNYYISGGYTSDEGFFKYSNNDIDIFNVKAKINANINKWWTIGTNIDYVKDKQSKPHDYLDWWHQMYSQRTYFPIINPVNNHYTSTPVAYLKDGSRDCSDETTMILSLDTKITPLKNWNIYGKYTHREYNEHSKDISKKLYLADNYGYTFPENSIWNGKAQTSSVSEYGENAKQNTIDLYSDYEIKLERGHYIKAMVGFNQMEYWNNAFKASRENMISDEVPSLNLTNGEDNVSQSEYDWATRSAFYRLNYSFKDRYLFEASGRYDGSSRFPKNSRFGFFPSFSIGWRISEEPFMQWSRKYMDNLKIRLSYGNLGNQDVSTYAYIASMDASKVSYLLGGHRPIGILPPELVASDLTWETVRNYNLGIDFSFFNNRLNGSFDFYKRETLDMLTSGDAMPGILGVSAPERNAADLATKGWELSLKWNDQIDKVRYSIGLTLADSRSKITKYDNPTGALSKRYVGQTIGEIWGYETEGFIDTEEKRNYINENRVQQFFYNGAWKLGDIQYRDIDMNGKIDRGEYTLKDHGDLKVIGNNQPRYSFGISLNAEWKGLSASAFFQGVGKRNLMPSGYMFWPFGYAWGNIQEHQLDTWSEDNPNAYYPQMEVEADRNYETQTKYLQNAAYIRLKNLSISYELPKQWLQHTFIEGVRLTLSGRNLWTLTDLIKPYDPELSNTNGLYYPLKREYAIGVVLNF